VKRRVRYGKSSKDQSNQGQQKNAPNLAGGLQCRWFRQKQAVMSDITQPDFILSLFLTAVIGGGIGGMFSAVWNAVVSRRFEEVKRLAALKTKVKRLLREKAANAASQKFEDPADELNELAQLTWVLKPTKRTKNNREVTSVDLLEAADMLRQAASAQCTDDRLEPRELIEKLRIRLSPQEEQRFPATQRH
jgi:hypothetical protein